MKPLLAGEGVLTRRKPDPDESRDIDYGRRVANALAGFDIGQSVAIAERACVALEAMEGTDAMLRARPRPGQTANRCALSKFHVVASILLFDVLLRASTRSA